MITSLCSRAPREERREGKEGGLSRIAIRGWIERVIKKGRERGGEKSVIFDYGSRLYVCPKAKDCQPANSGGRCVGVSVSLCGSLLTAHNLC